MKENHWKILDETYSTVTDKLIPYTIGTVYSFASGVAIITSLSAIAAQFLNYFSLTFLLGFSAPVALITGIVFAYLQHLQNVSDKEDFDIVKSEIISFKQKNKILEQKLALYFASPAHLEEKRQLSFKAGKVKSYSPFFKDKRPFLSRLYDFLVHFIKDAGLTFGATAFIITTFTTLPFSGVFLTGVILGSLLLAGLVYLAFHNRHFKFKLKLEAKIEQRNQEEQLNILYKNWFADNPDAHQIETKRTDTCEWYDKAEFNQGCLKNILDETYRVINIYLIRAKLIKLDTDNHQYCILDGRITELGDSIFAKANQNVGRLSRNVMMALKIALMIEHFYKTPDSYAALAHLINQLRATSRSYSIWNCFNHGRSKLADSLDEIFERTSLEALDYIESANSLTKVEVDEFEKSLDDKFQDHKNLLTNHKLISLPQ